MVDLTHRFFGREYMDDLDLAGTSLEAALNELVLVNRFLGGYAAIRSALKAYLQSRGSGAVTMIDLGSGLGDVAADLVKWADRRGVQLHVVAIEGNEEVARLADAWLNDQLPHRLRGRVVVEHRDVWNLNHDDRQFDVAISSLFLHHMTDEQALNLIRLMNDCTTDGLVINDLHRHPLAYQSIRMIGKAFRASSVFRHDAPLSVRRGFSRDELLELANAAGLSQASVRWHWAFRWTLSTVDSRV